MEQREDPTGETALVRRLIGGDPAAPAEVPWILAQNSRTAPRVEPTDEMREAADRLLRRAGIGVCLSTVLSRSKPEAIPATGGDRRSLDSRNQTIASAVGYGQLAWYRLMEQQGFIAVRVIPVLFGLMAIHLARKREAI